MATFSSIMISPIRRLRYLFSILTNNPLTVKTVSTIDIIDFFISTMELIKK